ncbi:hypothetical protein C6502_01305 [Candidatus Poribacteria bacterium]|nr:MAG: hypothetical protein C6502_01305 [Candidatus Poribacteria bacterium]
MLRFADNSKRKTKYDLLDEYKDCLDGTARFESFNRLSCDEPEAARSEAVAYSFFKRNGYPIQVEETPNEGGVDFRIQAESTDFVVEVTSILKKTYTEHSGMPEIISDRVGSVSLYKVPHLIRSKVSSKARQMSGMSEYDCPRILMIACEHPEYAYFLDDKEPFGPAGLLTSPPKISIPNGNNVTCLKDSLFFRFENDRIVFCRKSISAVLLFYISKYRAQATGLLHPNPVHNFSIELLPSVPFVEALISGIDATEGHTNTRWIPDNLPAGFFVYNDAAR